MINLVKYQCDGDRCNALNEAELLDASVPPFTQEPIEIQTTTGEASIETSHATETTTSKNAVSETTSTIETTHATESATTSTTDGTDSDSDGSFSSTLFSIVFLYLTLV